MTPAESGGEPGAAMPPRPYPGLRPFEKDEWPIFFGRERMADEVIARLIRQRLVFVHGDSGCGKSSLVRAGVFARLEQSCAGEGWRTQSALPRQAPLWNVAEALARLVGENGDEARVLDWRRALNFGRGAPEAIAALLARHPPGPVCLLIDQFEELFQHARLYGPEEARLLTQVLVALHESPPVGLYVVMTMRSEYLGACAGYEGFAELVNAVQYLLPRMGHEDMLRAIREPAPLYDGQVSRELAERLIADSGGQDQLPLIQHGLMRLYVQKCRTTAEGAWRLGIADFPREGGLAGLLSAHADEVAAAVRAGGEPGTRERLVEDVFRALTEINAEGKAIRRPQTLARLAAVSGVEVEVLRPVIDAFRADGVSFLSPHGNTPLAPEDLVDVGHEALIRCWRALADPARGWLSQEFRNGLIWRALLVQADSFEADPGNVLSPATTDEREAWLARRNPQWAERYGGGWERVQRLMAASVAARDRERREQAAALRKEGRAAVMRWGLVALGGLVVLLVGALYKAGVETEEARRQLEWRLSLTESLQAADTRAGQVREELEMSKDRAAKSAAALEQALSELKLSGGGGPSAAAAAKIDKATEELVSQASHLDKAAQYAAGPNAPAPIAVPPPAGPRVYMHIADPQQRAIAQKLEATLESLALEGRPVIVPDIRLVKVYPSRASLRCFDAAECRSQAPQLLAEINRVLASPEVRLEDLSDRYGGATGIRPGHYELWFPPGEIALRGP